MNNSEKQNVLLALNEIPVNEIESYIDENIEDFDTELIAEFVDESSIDIASFSNIADTNKVVSPVNKETKPTPILDEINKDDILKYLEEENIDLQELLDDEDSFI